MKPVLSVALLSPFIVAMIMMAIIFLRGRPFDYRRAVMVSAILFASPIIPVLILTIIADVGTSQWLRVVVFSAITWSLGTGTAVTMYRGMARTFNREQAVDNGCDRRMDRSRT